MCFDQSQSSPSPTKSFIGKVSQVCAQMGVDAFSRVRRLGVPRPTNRLWFRARRSPHRPGEEPLENDGERSLGENGVKSVCCSCGCTWHPSALHMSAAHNCCLTGHPCPDEPVFLGCRGPGVLPPPLGAPKLPPAPAPESPPAISCKVATSADDSRRNPLSNYAAEGPGCQFGHHANHPRNHDGGEISPQDFEPLTFCTLD